MIDERDEDDMSRCLARFVAGEDRLFSAICWERRWSSLTWWALRIIVDSHFRHRRGERSHCRHAYQRERAAMGDAPDRARYAGL